MSTYRAYRIPGSQPKNVSNKQIQNSTCISNHQNINILSYCSSKVVLTWKLMIWILIKKNNKEKEKHTDLTFKSKKNTKWRKDDGQDNFDKCSGSHIFCLESLCFATEKVKKMMMFLLAAEAITKYWNRRIAVMVLCYVKQVWNI